MLKLDRLMSVQRRNRRRQIKARSEPPLITSSSEFYSKQQDGCFASQAKRKGSPCQHDGNSLDCQMKGYTGPDLPEDIWRYIHSLMPLQDAARVACVSQAFLRFWRCHPNLSFSEETLGLNKKTCRYETSIYFTSRVDHILKKHSGIGVKTFKLLNPICNDQEFCHLDLDNWLQIAVKPGIEEVDLSLSYLNRAYNFPCSLLSNETGESLHHLQLLCCDFHPTVGLGCLKSLTILQLSIVCITGDELECLLSNSLALEKLELSSCSGIICLKIPFLRRLSYLTVVTCTELRMVESKAPNLSSFDLSAKVDIQLSLSGTSQIKTFQISYRTAFYSRTKLPSIMPNLEALCIYSNTEMVDTPMAPSKFLHLKFLSIALGGQTYDYFSLLSFLDASPSLESFFLNVCQVGTMRVSFLEDPSDLRKKQEHRHDRLKRVKIINFSSAKSLVELVCHILESTTSLECLTLDTTHGAPRCSVNSFGKCLRIHRDSLMEAHRALSVAQSYIKLKVPSAVELHVLEPCNRCHLVDL